MTSMDEFRHTNASFSSANDRPWLIIAAITQHPANVSVSQWPEDAMEKSTC